MTNIANTPSAVRVLSIDGGGVRGIVPAHILHEIETRTNKPISQLFDIITGTSTGGILASALATPDTNGNPKYKAADLVNFYLNDASKIFAPSALRKVFTGFGLWGSKYSSSEYDAILSQTFADTKLSQALCHLFLPIFSVDHNKPLIASSSAAKQNVSNDFYLRDIVAATSAAPTYFNPVKFKDVANTVTYTGADGGIYANNPEIIGVTGVYAMHPGLNIDDITLLSLGTGVTSTQNTKNEGNDGDVGWLQNKDIIGNMMDAESALAEIAITAILKNGHHFRYQVTLPEALDTMDNSNAANLTALVTAAENFINSNTQKIDALCKMLTT